MGLLDGGIASAFASAFGATFLDATLHRPVFTDDGMGGGSSAWADEPVKAQLDQTTQAMQAADGYVDTDQRILVLAAGTPAPSAPITAECEITAGGRRWMIAGVTTDPAGSYFDLHGRRKNA